MVRWFCPFCWKEVSEGDEICPHCGRDLRAFHSLSFEDKLLLGLDNPVTQTRMFIIELLGRKRVSKAADKLCSMLFEKRDIYELMAIAKALYSIGSKAAIDCLKRRSFSEDLTSNFIKELIKNSL
ncbi:MAG: HEAT repeat domain-containing protein [Aquificaceae bacterium]